jgi:hypothetical protein
MRHFPSAVGHVQAFLLHRANDVWRCTNCLKEAVWFRILPQNMSRGVDREPCPYRIVDDAGNAFLFGTSCNCRICHNIKL